MPRLGNGLWSWLGCSTLLAMGCSHTRPQPAPYPAPPPGWAPAPMVPGPAVPAGAPGCSSCGPATNPAVVAPRYTPPIPAPPPIPEYSVGGIVLGAPVMKPAVPAVAQAAFQPPAVPPAVRLGGATVEESLTLPLPPDETPPADVTKSSLFTRND